MAEEKGRGEPGETGQPGPVDQGDFTRPWFPAAPGGFPPDPGDQPGSGPFGQPPTSGGEPGPHGQPSGGNGQPGTYGQPGPYGQPPYGQPGSYGQPPYGQPGPYGQPPYGPPPRPYGQPAYARPPAPKPGVIPLRPIGVSEILDGAFTAIRRNPRATLGVGAVIMTIYGTVAAVVAPGAVTGLGFSSVGNTQQANQAQLQHELSNFGSELAGLGVTYLLLVIAGQILTGMLTVVMGRSVLGDQITAGESWRRTLPRLPAIFGATVLFCLVIIGLWAVYLGIGLGLVAAHAPSGAAVAYFALAAVAVLGLTVWLWTSFILANQVVVLERTGPARALGRSWRLVRHSFWRVLGIALLSELIVGIASAILQLPFSISANIITSHAGTPLHPPVVAVIIGTIGTIVSRAVTGALLAGVYVLLYVDLRMRKEGLDMALRTASGPAGTGTGTAGTAGTAGDEFATVWRPPARSAPAGHEQDPGPGHEQGPGYGQW